MIQKTVFMRNYSTSSPAFLSTIRKFCQEIFNAKLGREDIFKPTSGNEALHQDSDNGVRIEKFSTSKNLAETSSPDRTTQNQMDHILIDRRWHSSILDVRTVR